MSWTCPSCGQEWPEKPLVDGTIGCPICGNVAAADLRARLSAAEQERDAALGQLHYVPDDWRYAGRLRAKEARAEDAENALPTDLELTVLRNLNAAVDKHSEYWPGYLTLSAYIERVAAARAALAGREEQQ